MSNDAHVGQVRTWDYQSDIFGGQYQLIEKVPGERNVWIAERLAPTDEIIARMLAEEDEYCGGPREVAEAQERAGTRFKIKMVSQAEFDRHF